MKNNKGLAPIMVLLIILGIAVVGGVAYNSIKNHSKNQGQIIQTQEVNCSSSSNPSITVVSPNGGETYQAGQQITVKWRGCNVPGGMTFKNAMLLHDPNDTEFTTIDTTTLAQSPGVGFEGFTWTIPSTIDTTKKYKIYIETNQWSSGFPGETHSVNDESDNSFTINSPVPTPTVLTSAITCNGVGCTDGTTAQEFKMNLPEGSSLSAEYVEGSNYGKAYFFRLKTGEVPTNHFWILNTGKDPCPSGEAVTINGIQFSRKDENGGGMESSSLDSGYCTVHNGVTYVLAFTWGYARYTTVNVPDRATATQKFNSELKSLNFKFTTVSTDLPQDIGAQAGWPPVIQNIELGYSCGIKHSQNSDTVEKTINSKKYCVTDNYDGAAGSIYHTYTYATAYSSGTKVTSFTLRYTSCGAYDDPQMTQCKTAQSNFNANLDALVDSLMW